MNACFVQVTKYGEPCMTVGVRVWRRLGNKPVGWQTFGLFSTRCIAGFV